MLEYYKLALVRAGNNKRHFKREMRTALKELANPNERKALKDWFKRSTAKLNGQ
jgi:hypothetical protein